MLDRQRETPTEVNFNGLNSDGSVVAPGSPKKVISHISKGIFLGNLLRRLLQAGLVDFGVTGGVEVGSKSYVSLIQGMDDNVYKADEWF